MVTPTITFLGQSGFLLEYTNTRLLIDPQNKASGDLEADIVYCTHTHFDHTGGVNTFMEKNPTAILVCGVQTASKFTEWADRTKIVEDGDSYTHDSFTMHFKYCRHGLFKSVQNLAVEIHMEDLSFAHLGDACEFEGFPMNPVNILAVPIVGGFTANPGKAIRMIEAMVPRPTTVIPMHWMFRSPKAFCKNLHDRIPDITCIVPVAGERLAL